MWFLTCFFPNAFIHRWTFWKQHGIDVVVSITKMMTVKFGIENITTFCFVLRSKALLSKDMGEVFDLSKSCLDFGTLEVQQLEPPIDSKKLQSTQPFKHIPATQFEQSTIRAHQIWNHQTNSLRPSSHSSDQDPSDWHRADAVTCRLADLQRIDRIRINEFRFLCLFLYNLWSLFGHWRTDIKYQLLCHCGSVPAVVRAQLLRWKQGSMSTCITWLLMVVPWDALSAISGPCTRHLPTIQTDFDKSCCKVQNRIFCLLYLEGCNFSRVMWLVTSPLMCISCFHAASTPGAGAPSTEDVLQGLCAMAAARGFQLLLHPAVAGVGRI